MDLNSLSGYTKVDRQKQSLITEMLYDEVDARAKRDFFREDAKFDLAEDYCLSAPEPLPLKVCPECGKKYPGYENFCFDCDVKLKDIDKFNVKDIKVNHEFEFRGKNDLNDFNVIFTTDNIVRINDFEFKKTNFNTIIKNIKSTALKNMDAAIKENEINLDDLTILEKVMLFTKSFVDVDYKSYGGELGYYSFNRIFVDDRQLDSLQITTMFHELTHFLIKEILTQILCKLLDCTKSREIESIITFILSYSSENCLIDEYAAHTVEGRFTLFGYQDYSSFLNIQKSIDRSADEIEMLKTIGNTFSNVVKGIIESFIDDDLLGEIKRQFRQDILDNPDYSQLKLENCTLLTYEGFFRAVQFILLDGFSTASENIEKLCEINEMWSQNSY